MEFHVPSSVCIFHEADEPFRVWIFHGCCGNSSTVCQNRVQVVGSKLTRPSRLPSESVANACHSVVPAGPRAPSS
jgi:hypothetical protein